jgi:fructoselysine-6-P-deglycase FrlB-like protein
MTLGKPYQTELKKLPHTYAWALAQPIELLRKAVERLCAHPLLGVGSGGSFSVCHYAAHLHSVFTGQPSIPTTPLQAVDQRTPIGEMGIIIPTAGGNNPDVVAAVRLLSEQEPHALLVLCGNVKSRVAVQASRYKFVDFISYELPSGKDGFLATNSLLAFSILLSRAYLEVFGQLVKFPKDYGDLLSNRRNLTDIAVAERRYSKVLNKGTLLVLHGPATTAAAVDIESKFTEAALGNVQVCDFRQFAHGRHHWLAKRREDTAILSLETPNDKDVASQTLEFLPNSVPTERLRIAHDGWLGDLAGICEGLYLAGAAGIQQGIDPGRPGVPSFGRKLYHANAFRTRRSDALSAWKAKAIERKSSQRTERLETDGRLSFWFDAIESVIGELASTRFCGIVLDYDGTLCSEDQRFKPLAKEISARLTALLKSGVQLGIATGRGKSVKERLCESLPKKYWRQVIVGYYNGGQILPLHSPELPDGAEYVADELIGVREAIMCDRLLATGTTTLRRRQITITGIHSLDLETLCEHVEAVVHRVSASGYRVMRSGHSVDVVPDIVSKVSVVESLAKANGASAVLRIGDRGRWPGNDAQLLASPYGLSSHEVSSDAASCWNLAPPGCRGWQATLWYLQHVKVLSRGLRFQVPTGKGE